MTLITTSVAPNSHTVLPIPQTPIKKHIMKAALKKGVEDGTLIQVKNSYKLSPEAKKAAPKKKAAAAAKAKKPAAEKKKTTKTTTKKKVCRYNRNVCCFCNSNLNSLVV